MDGGPVINISGPGGASPNLPRISFDDNNGGMPSINIGGGDDGPSIPQISLPGESSSSPKKNQVQTRKMQETLSNPRLEAAKRSGLVCGGCGGPIIGRIVSAMDMRWHPGCFRCCVCDELLENLSRAIHTLSPPFSLSQALAYHASLPVESTSQWYAAVKAWEADSTQPNPFLVSRPSTFTIISNSHLD